MFGFLVPPRAGFAVARAGLLAAASRPEGPYLADCELPESPRPRVARRLPREEISRDRSRRRSRPRDPAGLELILRAPPRSPAAGRAVRFPGSMRAVPRWRSHRAPRP